MQENRDLCVCVRVCLCLSLSLSLSLSPVSPLTFFHLISNSFLIPRFGGSIVQRESCSKVAQMAQKSTPSEILNSLKGEKALLQKM